MQNATDTRRQQAADIAARAEVWSILADGGLMPGRSVEWLLDRLDRQAAEAHA